MKIQKIIVTTMLFGTFATFASPIFAGTSPHRLICCDDEIPFPFFLTFESGISFSRTAQISADPILWDPAFEGYNSKLHNSELYALGFGYQFTPLVNASITGTYRPSFKYQKFQTRIPGGRQSFPTDQKTRKFNLSNKALMASVSFNGQGMNLCTNIGSDIILQPVVGGGIGVSYNQTSNFYSILTTQSPGLSHVSIMGDGLANKTSFAWQLEGAIEMLYCQRFAVSLGYRYFDGGKFKTTDHVIPGIVAGTTPSAAAAAQVPAWNGKLRTQEIFLKLKYHFY